MTSIFLCLVLLFFIFNRFNITVFLNKIRLSGISFFDSDFNYPTFQKLKLENEALKSEIDFLKNQPESVALPNFNYLIADVYSFYPFNNRSLLVINQGKDNGLKEGLPVLAVKGVIIGKIKSVERTKSEVQTIFDSAWRSSAAIGERRIKAALIGGLSPLLQFVPKDAEIKAGDQVFNISPDLPFNFLVGKIEEVSRSNSSRNWLEAKLGVTYGEISNLDKVLVVLDFP